MQQMLGQPMYLGWSLAFVCALAALLKWKFRKQLAERRVAKGLRAYTAGSQVLS